MLSYHSLKNRCCFRSARKLRLSVLKKDSPPPPPPPFFFELMEWCTSSAPLEATTPPPPVAESATFQVLSRRKTPPSFNVPSPRCSPCPPSPRRSARRLVLSSRITVFFPVYCMAAQPNSCACETSRSPLLPNKPFLRNPPVPFPRICSLSLFGFAASWSFAASTTPKGARFS